MIRGRTTHDDLSPLRVALLGQGEGLANRVARAIEAVGVRVTLQRVESDDGVEEALVKFRAHVVVAASPNARPAIWSAYRVARAIRPTAPFILLMETLDEDAVVSFARYNPDDVVLVENLARLGPAIQRALGVRRALATLSPRQIEVLVKVAEGRRTREIAEQFGRSAKTVESHRSAVMKRLGLADVAAVVRFAVHMGLVPADPTEGQRLRAEKGGTPQHHRKHEAPPTSEGQAGLRDTREA